ncbi:KilA-N domain-containing protein [Solidesulfovibrio magneticus]|uniref:KilA-N domain-containing protein n=1 Tax=Solidesulfovibrio magneticus TaxID=184917 RepID=UPI0011D16A7E|nr:KilA-N domain-containing protein [Solidesulfovibrio magneticus]
MLPPKIIIGKSPVSTNADGLISLTDLWKAAGKNPSQRIPEWLRLPATNNFVNRVSEKEKVGKSHLLKAVPGRNGGTFAHWQIALAYAKYLSPELHMAVNDVFMRYKAGDPKLAEEVIDKVEDLAALERIERRARAKKQYKRLASVVFAKGGHRKTIAHGFFERRSCLTVTRTDSGLQPTWGPYPRSELCFGSFCLLETPRAKWPDTRSSQGVVLAVLCGYPAGRVRHLPW